MTTARATQVDPTVTPYYHCISRCVRRAFLCGDDPYTGENFDHRKGWIVERLSFLATVFTIDVCAYAVMSNHLHLILRLMSERARKLSQEQVAERYCKVFPGSRDTLAALPDPDRDALIELWRERLCSISWLMRALNEWVARRANQEDGCTGRFWEGRFKSKALLDDKGLLTCMAYVDLNPHRAGVSDSLEASDFTSIQARLEAAHAVQPAKQQAPPRPASVKLAPMADDKGRRYDERLPIDFATYVELLTWTANVQRGVRIERRERVPALLTQMGLCPDGWLSAMRAHQLAKCSALGELDALDREAQRRGQAWLHGKSISRRLRMSAAAR